MQPKIYSVSDHDIQPTRVDSDALLVIQRLQEAGHTAYLVGGSVRDLLLNRTPKDFDISTSASPEEIKQIFGRQCLLIGRRFRLAHVRFGHKIIEVSTFRAEERESDEIVMRDNEWGTPIEDALRRDFTINGLFYNPSTHEIIDYVGGWEDIHSNTLRVIGDPEMRFKQDPVRMIRLIKFRARFNFDVVPEARKALVKCRQEILKSSSARLLEEILRMLESGAAAPFFHLLSDSGMLELIYPTLNQFLRTPEGKQIYLFLSCADKMNQAVGKKVLDRPILMASLLFPFLVHDVQEQFLDRNRTPHMGDIITLTSATVRKFETGAFVHFPKRLVSLMNAVLSMQYRLTPPSGKRHPTPKVCRFKEFAPALLFLKMRAIVDKELIETYTEWKTLYRQIMHNERKGHHHPPPVMRAPR